MSAPVSAISGRAMQIGVETTEGSEVNCNKKFQSISFNIAPHIETQQYDPEGSFFPTSFIPTQDYTEGDITGVGSYNELAYLFASVFGYAAPVIIAAGPAYTWTHAVGVSTANAHKSYTVEQGSAGAGGADLAVGVVVNELSLDMSRASGIAVGGSVLGRLYTTGATFTATPTAIPYAPILPTHINVYLDDTAWADLGDTQLLDDIAVNFSFGPRFTPWWALNSANASYAAKVNARPGTDVTLRMAANAVGKAYLARIRAAQTVFVRVEATGTTAIDTGVFHKFTLDMALQYTGGAGNDEDSDALVIEAPMAVVADGVSGNAVQAVLINTLDAL